MPETKKQLNSTKKPSLKITEVRFTPTAGVEQRLRKVYEVLLTARDENDSASEEDGLIQRKVLED